MKIDVILLAAGYSTRLYPLTKNFPKPLLEVAGKPVITNIVEKLENLEDINKIYLVTNNRYFNYFAEKEKSIKNPVLMIGGDNLFDFQLNDVISYFKEKNRDVVSVSRVEEK